MNKKMSYNKFQKYQEEEKLVQLMHFKFLLKYQIPTNLILVKANFGNSHQIYQMLQWVFMISALKVFHFVLIKCSEAYPEYIILKKKNSRFLNHKKHKISVEDKVKIYYFTSKFKILIKLKVSIESTLVNKHYKNHKN